MQASGERNTGHQLTLRVGEFLRGRIINAMGQPIDGKPPFEGGDAYCVGGSYINPLRRPPIRERMEFGVKAIGCHHQYGAAHALLAQVLLDEFQNLAPPFAHQGDDVRATTSSL